MNQQQESALTNWTRLGSLPAGSISALAAGHGESLTLFAGTQVGLFRANELHDQMPAGWQRLARAPVGILALATSPGFVTDQTVLAGAEEGIWRSTDAGENWELAKMPLSSSTVLSIAFSPRFEDDGVVLAGTLEDGVIFSNNRGAQWSGRSFGMLDPAVLSLAISPTFAQDGTAFAGTDTSLYTTYNHARAWKPLPFPEESAPILSLAVSAKFAEDRTLFAGTEHSGLFRSLDAGKSWSRVDFPADSINGLLVVGDNAAMYAATEQGVFRSTDMGEYWDHLLDLPDALCLGANANLIFAGMVDAGMWALNGADWAPVVELSARPVVGFALSDRVDQDGLGYAWGPQEGIWRTEDGGHSWSPYIENLPTLDITGLALHPDFSRSRMMAAASPEGLFISRDGGDTWEVSAGGPVDRLAFSQNGRILAASFPGEGVRISEDLGQTWQAVPGPWDAGGEVLALAVSGVRQVHVALLEGVGETISIWQGEPGALEMILSHPAGERGVATFWFPPEPAAHRPWYAAIGSSVWKLSGRNGVQPQALPACPEGIVTDLSGWTERGQERLLACTGEALYQAAPGQEWRLVQSFNPERALRILKSPKHPGMFYALLLGGSFFQGILD